MCTKIQKAQPLILNQVSELTVKREAKMFLKLILILSRMNIIGGLCSITKKENYYAVVYSSGGIYGITYYITTTLFPIMKW